MVEKGTGFGMEGFIASKAAETRLDTVVTCGEYHSGKGIESLFLLRRMECGQSGKKYSKKSASRGSTVWRTLSPSLLHPQAGLEYVYGAYSSKWCKNFVGSTSGRMRIPTNGSEVRNSINCRQNCMCRELGWTIISICRREELQGDKDKKIEELKMELEHQEQLCIAYREKLFNFISNVEEQTEELSSKIQVIIGNECTVAIDVLN
ncbi:protein FAR1-RELATED SEQUENCE 5 [Cucumis melo var. makuwa]|uniref:Protein FAR1-RELATED SEQUENCE 5 n=1 Tax=Cucumis melo var. makuwa TaxID=1194695 RepID=A0A5D3CCS7_CUCMM|nr:protein FAR1-RELATED SEQUENCE 5 [Cucumis melo var. makuwa]TYK08166.1 protein FAR1-RELATED SEQUENCE 5 [Cucumis melo var. makuwa]